MKETIKGLSVSTNLMAVSAAEFISRIAQIVAISAISNNLGAAGLGIVGTAWAYYNMMLSFVQHSPELIGIRKISSNRCRLSIIGEINLIKLLAAIIIGVGLSLFVLIFYSGQRANQMQILMQSSVLIGVAFSVGWVFQGFQHFEIHAAFRMFQSISMALALYLLLSIFRNPLMVPLIELSTFLVAGFIGFTILRRWLESSHPHWDSTTDFLFIARDRRAVYLHGKAILIQGLTGFMSTVTWSACIPIAGIFLTISQIGYLTAAIRLILVANSVILLLLQLFYPIFSRGYVHNPERTQEIAASLFFYTTIIVCAASIILFVFAKPICYTIFGQDFVGAYMPIKLFSITLIPSGLGSIYTYLLLSVGRERTVFLILACGSFATIAINIIAFSIWQVPSAASSIAVVLVLQAIPMGFVSHRLKLIKQPFLLRRLSPIEIKKFLRTR